MAEQSMYDETADAQFKEPYVDRDEWRDTPLRHHYMHGGFMGTNVRFSCYFPPEETYQGRFFQFLSPVQGSEDAAQEGQGAENKIGFAISHGAYFVESNMGGFQQEDLSLIYRSSAATAQYSRVLAAQLYGESRGRPYGYVYGGSGGGFKTLGCIENTRGVWDGAVPYVIGTPMAAPYNFTVRVHAMGILWNKFPSIIDALEPGGSGDIYAGLNAEEKAALKEVTDFGFPPYTWAAYKYIGDGALPVLAPAVFQGDPSYFEDFWKLPGYLGADPNSSVAKRRTRFETVVTSVVLPGKIEQGVLAGVDEAWHRTLGNETGGALQLEQIPAIESGKAFLTFTSGEAKGQRLTIKGYKDRFALAETGFGLDANQELLTKVRPGDTCLLDNSDLLAIQTYHRHQLPSVGEFPVWDALFRDEAGQPRYPQRSFVLGPLIASGGGGGGTQNGRFEAKMIVVECLKDESALSWSADWYRGRVKAVLGDKIDDQFRLWYIDHSLHGDIEVVDVEEHALYSRYFVPYIGALHQALLDVAAWVEEGKTPPASTDYTISGGQVQVPPTAAARKGVQPVISAKANGGVCARVSVGDTVRFTAEVEAPPDTGKLVAAEWDFEGSGNKRVKAELVSTRAEGSTARVESSYTFSKPGTYFPICYTASNREGDAHALYTQVRNLCRLRVVVSAKN